MPPDKRHSVAKLFDEIQKFNPYHDSKGRFTTAGTASFFTYAPGKSRAHDNAIAREKERAKQRAESGGSGSKPEQDDIKAMQQKFDQLGQKMSEMAQYATPGSNYDDSKASKYYELKRQHNDLRSKINAKKDEEAKKRPKSKPEHRTFINGYGEATRRDITSATYERAQRRLNREIDRRFGIGKSESFDELEEI